MMRRSILAAVVLTTIVAIAACTSTKTEPPGPFSVGVAFDNPPVYPGYQWTRNGKAVPGSRRPSLRLPAPGCGLPECRALEVLHSGPERGHGWDVYAAAR